MNPKHIAVLLLFLATLCRKADAPATSESLVRYAASDNGLILRAAPSTTAESLGSLSFGTAVTILESGPVETISGRQAAWQKVSADGKVGYVFGGFLSEQEIDLPIRKSELTLSPWGPERDGFGYYVTFREDGTFTENFAGEGCGKYKGIYKIENGRVFMEPSEPGYFCNRPAKSCFLQRVPESLFATSELRCDDSEKSSYFAGALKADTRREVEGIPVVTMGLRSGATTTNAKYRAAPDLQAPEYSCTYGTESTGEGDKTTPYIPEGTHLKIVARTLKMERIGDWVNYWYYVLPDGGWYAGGCDPPLGWVFAEFVQPHN